MELVKICDEKLKEVKKKIEILSKKGEKLVPEPFEEKAE